MPTEKTNIIANLLNIFAFETITVAGTAVELTESTYTDSNGKVAKKALITVESAQLRWRADGTAPTSSVGHALNPYDSLILIGSENIRNFKSIRVGSTSAKISVSYSF